MGAFRNAVEGIKDIAKSFDEKNYNPDLLGMITVIVDLGHTVWEKQEADRVGGAAKEPKRVNTDNIHEITKLSISNADFGSG
ncbi:hypothetical protein V491_05664 [Pseudogymnoascus sp. VKM F-3775]|nr:hypothetical protein V491_05664 [Pseudogymnoascus sp. VKM F-3775]